jgi:HSP20 family protein
MPSLARTMAEMENEMDRWMQASGRWPEEMERLAFTPTCNFKENDKEYIVQFDIPGVKKDEVKIEIQNNRLTVSGERKERKEEKDAKHFLSEAYYGSFMRSFSLPAELDESKVDAHYEDGVLTIKVPKTAVTKAKEVKIQ